MTSYLTAPQKEISLHRKVYVETTPDIDTWMDGCEWGARNPFRKKSRSKDLFAKSFSLFNDLFRDSFNDSFTVSFSDLFNDSFRDSFWDLFSDSVACSTKGCLFPNRTGHHCEPFILYTAPCVADVDQTPFNFVSSVIRM